MVRWIVGRSLPGSDWNPQRLYRLLRMGATGMGIAKEIMFSDLFESAHFKREAWILGRPLAKRWGCMKAFKAGGPAGRWLSRAFSY